MAFDQNSDLPVVNIHKKTTQVNVGVIVGVVLFFVISAAIIIWISRHKAEMVNDVHEKQKSESSSP